MEYRLYANGSPSYTVGMLMFRMFIALFLVGTLPLVGNGNPPPAPPTPGDFEQFIRELYTDLEQANPTQRVERIGMVMATEEEMNTLFGNDGPGIWPMVLEAYSTLVNRVAQDESFIQPIHSFEVMDVRALPRFEVILQYMPRDLPVYVPVAKNENDQPFGLLAPCFYLDQRWIYLPKPSLFPGLIQRYRLLLKEQESTS